MPLFAADFAERELARALADGPFSRALSLAIDRSGLGLARLRDRLAGAGVPVSTTTLSYWRTGRTRPERPDSLRAVAVLEDVLGVPARALTELLARPGHPGAPDPVRWERLWVPATGFSRRCGRSTRPRRRPW
ncbi:transcriptional regulator [Amycolatopsis kentuckyensis]|uniref:transcriptional regulator n=1 Tax=Amycolatopsis kentuckyensis TaxID=218823 RepID=UPI003562B8B4